MHKVIHSNFEIDLSLIKITTINENHWYNNQFFSKYSFPFDIEITETSNGYFQYFLDHNSIETETFFEIQYVLDFIQERGTIEITNQVDNKLTLIMRYGIDDLPNGSVLLSELPLGIIPIENISTHIISTLEIGYPEVTYNFPQIHTNKYKQQPEMFAEFKGIINNYDGEQFLGNERIAGTLYNRNIIKPIPYILHVLKTGFTSAGYDVIGDIFLNPIINKMLLYSSVDYYQPTEKIIFKKTENEYTLISNTFNHYNYTISVNPGTYKLKGVAKMIINHSFISTFYVLSDSGSMIAGSANLNIPTLPSIDEGILTTNIDVEFTVPDDGNNHSIEFILIHKLGNYSNFNVFDFEIIQKYFLINNNVDIDLSRSVPNITFSKYVTELKKLFNLDIKKHENIIEINFIEDQMNYSNSINLEDLKIKKPKKSFKRSSSFLFKYKDVDSDKFHFDEIYHSVDGIISEGLPIDKEVTKIVVDALPLPSKLDNVSTAFSFENKDDKMYFVIYDGLFNNINTTQIDITHLKIPAIHNLYHKKWLKFRINSFKYEWLFYLTSEKLQFFDIRKKIFAYGMYHIMKRFSATQIEPGLFKIEIETNLIK